MREIKFRAWHKKDKVMLGHRMACATSHFTQSRAYTKDEIELMQYTGLTDKNGTKVYEGDIVKVYQHDEVLFNHHVEWSDANGCCSIVVNHSDYDITTMAWAEGQFCYEYEVIGNIHSNPELLEQNDDYK